MAKKEEEVKQPVVAPTVRTAKEYGKNDDHILSQVEKRFRKLRKLQKEKEYVQTEELSIIHICVLGSALA